MSTDRRAPTRAIKAAVGGREVEVLEKLGIDWRSGSAHITCPYPAHDDNDPSWRWDEKKACAFCTCIDKSHSIFDVVANKEGIAESLLKAPVENRDDTLPRAYLAHRLSVPTEEV